ADARRRQGWPGQHEGAVPARRCQRRTFRTRVRRRRADAGPGRDQAAARCRRGSGATAAGRCGGLGARIAHRIIHRRRAAGRAATSQPGQPTVQRMATHLDLQEQEQVDALKAFWQQYGNLITWTLVAALLVYAGINGWQWWQRNQATQAGAMYEELDRAVNAGD